MIKRLWHEIFHMVPSLNPRPISALQLRCRAWYGSIGLIPGPIWKMSCNNLLLVSGLMLWTLIIWNIYPRNNLNYRIASFNNTIYIVFSYLIKKSRYQIQCARRFSGIAFISTLKVKMLERQISCICCTSQSTILHCGIVYSIQHYVRKFISDLGQVGGFLRVLQFPLPL